MTALKMFLCSATLLGLVSAQNVPSFSSFVQTYGRSYAKNSIEYSQRRALYEKRAADASSHNARENRLWTAGVNELWDWNPSEMTSLMGWVDAARPEHSVGGSRLQSIQRTGFLQSKVNLSLPEEKDWSHLKTLQYVKSQGGCGSCWALAAVTTLEANTEIHSTHRTFSAQEIVNCVPNPQECGGQGGCRGATVELAVDWVLKQGAFEEYQAPYVGQDMMCHTPGDQALVAHQSKAGASFGMHGWETLPKNKYEPLLRSLAENGPTAVSVDATAWHMYSQGIFDGCLKDAIINHAVVAIGYGQDKQSGKKFWNIQNSWGLQWGEKGHIRVLRRDDDEQQCGIDNKPEMGNGCKGGPKQVTVCGMCGILYDSVAVHVGGQTK
jgi:cathepsin L